LQVAEIDHVKINQAQVSYPCRRKIKG